MSRSKAKGTAAETAVITYLREHGFPTAERRALHGTSDWGDVAGVPGVVIEVKNCARVEIAAWVDEARAECQNAGAAYGVVWHKRRGKGRRGGLRIIYYWWPAGAQLWLFAIYDKNEVRDLTPLQRTFLKKLLISERNSRH